MLLYRFNKLFVLLEYGYLTIFIVIAMTLGYRQFYDFPECVVEGAELGHGQDMVYLPPGAIL